MKYKIIKEKQNALKLENIAITGRTFEEYSSFFDLKKVDFEFQPKANYYLKILKS
ncbi:hypothetical protein [Arcobacter suis]|uniref:hypothetical protein n=1 Tax=Arcobacter suis TaxID=1278212 RepID=UPI00129B4136|nr:hypothetical protein [Arcobacter suis]